MIKFSVKRRNDFSRKDGRAALYAVLSIQRQKVRINLDIAVTADEWDPVKEMVRGRGKNVRDMNLIISDTKAKISDVLVKFRLSGEPLTRERFLHCFHHPDGSANFLEYARGRLAKLSGVLQPQTVTHHLTVLKKLEEYDPHLRLSDITTDWLRIYAAHLRDFHNNNPGTIEKNLSTIRIHYFAAMREGKI